MKFKTILPSIILGFSLSELAHSQPLHPPTSVIENDKLLHSSVFKYVSLYNKVIMISNRINKVSITCSKTVQNKINLCQKTCDPKAFNELKQKSLGCIKAFIGFQTPLRREVISNVEFKNSLTSGLYDNLPDFKLKMTGASDSLSIQYKKINETTAKLSNEYSSFYQNLLKAQYQQAQKDGKLSENIVEICTQLKREISILKSTYYLSLFNQSLIYWSKFEDKVKGYSILANSLHPYCPNNISTAQYDDLLKLISKQTRALSNTSEIKKLCNGPISKEYFADYCKGTFALDPYAISVLSGGK